MRIVSWNCNKMFRERYKDITAEEDDDIYVICECENPIKYECTDYSEFAGNNYYWTGDLDYMGLEYLQKKILN